MRKYTIAALISGLTLCAASLAMAAGQGGVHSGAAPAPPAKSEAVENSNGKVGADRDKGLARADDRRASKSIHKTHGHKRHSKHTKAVGAKAHP